MIVNSILRVNYNIEFSNAKCVLVFDASPPSMQVCAETGDEMRYGEVWAHVRCLASALVRRGIQKGSTVALITPNCPEYVLAFLAATSVGAMLTTINSHFNAGKHQSIYNNYFLTICSIP